MDNLSRDMMPPCVFDKKAMTGYPTSLKPLYSNDFESFRSIPTSNSGNPTTHSGKNSKNGRNHPESVVELNRNGWSIQIGISGRIAPEYAPEGRGRLPS
jgi:hypothetical protein